MKIKTKIELDEKDLKELIAEKFNLNKETTTISINKYNGDGREASYTNIIVEGEKSDNNR
jgi:hypothetical protein